MLKRAKNFIEYDSDGAIKRMFCKICGTAIAGTTYRPKGSGLKIDQLVEKFIRFPVYAEMKLECNDGSFHVTHGCKDCITTMQPIAVLRELWRSDLEEAGMVPPLGVEPLGVVAIDTTGSGIV